MVELALLLPFLLWVCAGVFDFGRVYYYDIVMINAARCGARLAADIGKDDTAIRTAVKNEASPIVVTDDKITISPAYPRSSGVDATVTVTYSFTPITPLIGGLFPGGKLTVSKTATMVAY